jgi:hypothetical protein
MSADGIFISIALAMGGIIIYHMIAFIVEKME